VARDLRALLERLDTDKKFAKLLKDDPEAAARDLGWQPRELVTFGTAKEGKGGCGTVCGCTADMGQGCGSKRGNIASCPSGKPGTVY
jgi:hypothetical protein